MNKIKGETPLNLSDGRRFVLVMDMEALVEAESAYGKPLQKMMADASQGFVGASRALLFGALRAKHPDVTLRDASTIFMTNPDVTGEALTAAAEAAMPEASVPEDKKPGKSPRGKTSGGNGVKPA